MALRTVRLDDASEEILKELMAETGKSISTLLKEGLMALQGLQRGTAPQRPGAQTCREPAPGRTDDHDTELRRGVREAMRRRNLRV